jgi:hypothetical protein
VAVQSQGATRVRFINNTIWGGGLGGLLLRQSQRLGDAGAAHDSVVVNNILGGYGLTGGASTARFTDNFVANPKVGRNAGNLFGPDPGIAKPFAGNYSLRKRAPARGRGAADVAPPRDLCGRRRPRRPSLGAFERGPVPPRGSTPLLLREPSCQPRAHRKRRH